MRSGDLFCWLPGWHQEGIRNCFISAHCWMFLTFSDAKVGYTVLESTALMLTYMLAYCGRPME